MHTTHANSRLALLLLYLFVVSALLCLAGCGGKANKTARGTAQAFVHFMKAAQYKDAALLWDYTDQTSENPDFGTAASGQQKLIIGKLAEEKAQVMEQWSSHFSGDVKVMTVEESGETAKATVEGGGISGLDLVKQEDGWHVTAIN